MPFTMFLVKKILAEGGISLGEYPYHVWAACLIEQQH